MNKKTKNVFEAEEIVEYIRTKKEGEIISFKELQNYTTYNLSDEIGNYRFKQNIISRVKNDLIEYGYILKSIRYKGYYILKSNQIQSYTYRNYIRKPLKQFEKAEKILNHTKVTNLNSEELNRHRLTYNLNEKLINENIKILNQKEFKDLDIRKES